MGQCKFQIFDMLVGILVFFLLTVLPLLNLLATLFDVLLSKLHYLTNQVVFRIYMHPELFDIDV